MGIANDRISLSQVVSDKLDAYIAGVKEWRTQHREDHEKLDKRMEEFSRLEPVIKLIMWIGAALGISIVGLIWSLVTGQVQLIFR